MSKHIAKIIEALRDKNNVSEVKLDAGVNRFPHRFILSIQVDGQVVECAYDPTVEMISECYDMESCFRELEDICQMEYEFTNKSC